MESRLSRCLLHTHDLSGDYRLLLTQEAMAQMIGARRNSVSLVANTLQQANFIHYSRGHIQILNLDGLRQTACECYATVKAPVRPAARARAGRRHLVNRAANAGLQTRIVLLPELKSEWRRHPGRVPRAVQAARQTNRDQDRPKPCLK